MFETVLNGILAFEAALCLLLSIPFANRACQSAVNFLDSNFGGKNSRLGYVFSVSFALTVVLFLVSFKEVLAARSHPSDSDAAVIRFLERQQEVYLSGFVLFLFMLLRLIYRNMCTMIKQDRSLEALKKQAEGVSKEYARLQKENESLELRATSSTAQSANNSSEDGKCNGNDPSTNLAELRDGCLEVGPDVSELVLRLEREIKSANVDLEAMRKQSASSADAFMRIMEEKAALARRLQDFEDIMGDKKKKEL